MLAEKIGVGGIESVTTEPFPPLAIADTEEVLEKIGNKWSLPEPFSRFALFSYTQSNNKMFQDHCDGIFLGWIKFCDTALLGFRNAKRTINEGIIKLDYESIYQAGLMTQVLPKNKEGYTKTIKNIRSAFIQLISNDARTKLGLKKGNIIDVGNETRDIIINMVKKMGYLSNSYYSDLFQKLREFEND